MELSLKGGAGGVQAGIWERKSRSKVGGSVTTGVVCCIKDGASLPLLAPSEGSPSTLDFSCFPEHTLSPTHWLVCLPSMGGTDDSCGTELSSAGGP